MERPPRLLIQPLSPAEIAIQEMADEGCPHPVVEPKSELNTEPNSKSTKGQQANSSTV